MPRSLPLITRLGTCPETKPYFRSLTFQVGPCLSPRLGESGYISISGQLVNRLVCAVLLLVGCASGTSAAGNDWFQKKTAWHGFDQFHFTSAKRAAYVVVPKKSAVGNPWVWRARFPNFHFEMDVELLKRGFHIGYVDVGGMFGSPRAMKIADEFYEFMTDKRGLNPKPAMEGVSRGGLFVYHRAMLHPDKLSCIYCDTPVLDFKSWPGGKGKGIGSPGTWKACLAAWNFTEEEALAYPGNPVDAAAQVVVDHKIPVLHIVSETDEVVPPAENTYVLQSRLKKLGSDLPVISVPEGTKKSHGHHFTHPDPDRVVQFILNNTVAGQ